MLNLMVYMAQTVPEGRLFALDSQTLISIGIQLVNGIILAVALGLILYKPVKSFMDKRTEGIRARFESADKAMAKADELIAEYNKKMEQVERERIEILESARLQAAREGREILEQAKREAEEISKRTYESIEKDKARLQEETRRYVIELASLIAEKYIARSIDEEIQDKLFDEALARMEDAQWLH